MKNEDSGKIPLGIYIHIPFCIRKCLYCDFLSGPADVEEQETYVRTLLDEIRMYSGQAEDYQVKTVFLGGGTPSILPGRWIVRILETLRETFDVEQHAEVSLEANPGTVTEEKLDQWKAAGVNRLSFGLQSVNDGELVMLGRIHTCAQFLESWALSEQAGFGNRNVDLMSALPGQTLQSWEQTLRTVAALCPEHISAYSLIVEEGTPFYQRFAGPGSPDFSLLPDEDTEREMYHLTRHVLEEYGYARYEISNYARPGFICCHNRSYWDGTEYLGFGTGASSYIRVDPVSGTVSAMTAEKEQYVRQRNCSDLMDYIQRVNRHHIPVDERINLTRENRMEEYVFLGLRMQRGISDAVFQNRFGVSFSEIYGSVTERLLQEGLLARTVEGVRLTEYGTDISNYVFAQYLL